MDRFGPLMCAIRALRSHLRATILGSVKVEDPSGQVWRVSRRWVPWRRGRWQDVGPGDPSGLGLALPDDPAGLVLVIVVVLIAVLGPFLLVPIFLAAELLLLLLLVPFAVVGRVVLGRRWCVELRRGWSPWAEHPAGDWRASTVRIHEMADAVRRGQLPLRTIGATEDSGI